MNSKASTSPTLALPVILSGGAGTRLWPISRKDKPKQFQKMMGEEHSFFQNTLIRVAKAGLFAPPLIIGGAEHGHHVREQLTELDYQSGAVLLEPIGKNTAPAILASALWAKEQGYECIVVMPSDHYIDNIAAFHRDMEQGTACCISQKTSVYLGIKPDTPHTEYGYIQYDNDGKLKKFVEKPCLEMAESLLNEGAVWNSGIFILHINTFLEDMQNIDPDMVEHTKKALAHGEQTKDGLQLDTKSYEELKSISFDHAYSEKNMGGIVLQASFTWSDMGSWNSMMQHAKKDSDDCVIIGNVITSDTRNSFISTEGQLIGVHGMENVIVVATKDAVLITSTDKTHDLKNLIAGLKAEGKPQLEGHALSHRTWGNREVLSKNAQGCITTLSITQGQSIRIDGEEHGTRHWVITQGIIKVTPATATPFMLEKGQSFSLSRNTDYVCTNPSKGETLEIVEVYTKSASHNIVTQSKKEARSHG